MLYHQRISISIMSRCISSVLYLVHFALRQLEALIKPFLWPPLSSSLSAQGCTAQWSLFPALIPLTGSALVTSICKKKANQLTSFLLPLWGRSKLPFQLYCFLIALCPTSFCLALWQIQEERKLSHWMKLHNEKTGKQILLCSLVISRS